MFSYLSYPMQLPIIKDVSIQCTSFKKDYKKKFFFDLHILLYSCQVWLQTNFENEVE